MRDSLGSAGWAQGIPIPRDQTSGQSSSDRASSDRASSDRAVTHTGQLLKKGEGLLRKKQPTVVKQLSLRIEDSTHHKITLAAQKAGKSINAWMEEILAMAADDVLECWQQDEISAQAIRSMLDNPNYSILLIEGITPYLIDSHPSTIFQFSNALKKLLSALDKLKLLQPESQVNGLSPLVQELVQPRSGTVSELAAITLPYLADETTTTTIHFTTALKKFLLGILAILPFVKGEKTSEKTANLLRIIAFIEEILSEIESKAAKY